MLLLTTWQRGSTQIIGRTTVEAEPGSSVIKRIILSVYRCVCVGGGGVWKCCGSAAMRASMGAPLAPAVALPPEQRASCTQLLPLLPSSVPP
jgi:hypothetical protein